MKKILLIAIMALPLLMSAEEKTVGYLGVATEELSEAMKTALGLEHGLLVSKVYENSPAEKTDIKIGDIIVEIDGEKITDYHTLKSIIAARPNKKAKLQIIRSNKTMTKDVQIAERTKASFDFKMEIPDIGDIKDIVGQGSKELKEELNKIKQEMEKIKEEIEDLKKRIK